MDDAARYEHRTHLKTDLLRSHLRGYLADDYIYSKKKPAAQLDDHVERADEDEG
jgi:hypothetical protein